MTQATMVSQGDQTDEDIHHTCREEADRLRRELDEKLALLAERDARLASLQSELESANVALAEMVQRRETADSLIVSLREELAHERDQADIARRTALEQTDALHEQMTKLQADLERSQAAERESSEKWGAEQRRTEGLQEELKASQWRRPPNVNVPTPSHDSSLSYKRV
ncbi:hypothetical protein BDF22DRAFT_493690 [Syncephalis plumigaleata]|nr:hypothetical protein BDF22DRAFT_493690 [Syncephalis plumigaleata]